MSNPVLVEVTRGAAGGEPPPRRRRGEPMPQGRSVFAVGDVDCAGLSALGDQGVAGHCPRRRRRRRPIWLWRRGTGARLRFAQRRAGTHRRRRADAGEQPASMPRRCAAARIGRFRSPPLMRWRGPARRRRWITIAPASTPAFSASPARWAPIPPNIFVPSIRCSGRCAPCWRISPAPSLAKRSAPSTVARCRPGRCRCKISRMDLPNSAPVTVWRQPAPRAAARLRQACAAKPWFVAGTGRFCTEIMQLFGERVFVKTGAEGVYCGALPRQGLGIAIKCDDGAARAAQADHGGDDCALSAARRSRARGAGTIDAAGVAQLERF